MSTTHYEELLMERNEVLGQFANEVDITWLRSHVWLVMSQAERLAEATAADESFISVDYWDDCPGDRALLAPSLYDSRWEKESP